MASGGVKGGSMILGAIPAEDGDRVLAAYADAGIRAYLFPGVFAFRPDEFASLTELARRLCEKAGLGDPLIALGGWEKPLCVLPVLPDFPSPLCLGASRDRAAARQVGHSLAGYLASLGVNFIFGPKLNLATDPKMPGGILDLFGETPEEVSALGEAYGRGLITGGVIPCAGLFPGGGLLVSDGHLSQSLLPLPEERLLSVEMRPFARFARVRGASILVGRFAVPAFEPEQIPAACSSRVVSGRLRGQLGFKGLVVGAPLDEDSEGPGRAALLGSLAGCDLTVALDPSAALEAASALNHAADSGELPAVNIGQSEKRLSRLIAKVVGGPGLTKARRAGIGLGLFGRRKMGRGSPEKSRRDQLELRVARSAPLWERFVEKGASVLRGVSPAGAEAGAVQDRSFCPKSVPLRIFLFEPRVGPYAVQAPRFRETLLKELRLPESRLICLPADPEPSDADLVLDAADMDRKTPGPPKAVLVLSYNAHLRASQESVIHLIEENFGAVSIIALKDPYDAAFFPRARALGAVYGFSPETARAAARLAAGGLEARGRCPVSVIGLEL